MCVYVSFLQIPLALAQNEAALMLLAMLEGGISSETVSILYKVMDVPQLFCNLNRMHQLLDDLDKERHSLDGMELTLSRDFKDEMQTLGVRVHILLSRFHDSIPDILAQVSVCPRDTCSHSFIHVCFALQLKPKSHSDNITKRSKDMPLFRSHVESVEISRNGALERVL